MKQCGLYPRIYSMLYGLTDKELQYIVSLLSENTKIHKAVLYGSRAKGNFKPFSDVDIALFGDELSQKDVKELLVEINDSNFPYQVDLVVYKSIKNQDLIDHINRVGISLI